MKIVHVIASLGMGGAETLLAQLAKIQTQDGHEVHIVTLLRARDVVIAPGIAVHSLSKGSASASIMVMIARLTHILRSLQADVIHAHMLHSNLLTRILHPLYPKSLLISTVHSTFETSNRWYRIAYRMLDRWADVTVFVSNEAQQRYEREGLTPPQRSAVVYNGIDAEYFSFNREARPKIRCELGIKEDSILLTAIGRLTEQKDYPTLLDAFGRIVLDYPNAHLLIVGDGQLRDSLTKFVRSQTWANCVTFAGIRTDIPDILSASDLLVLSSEFEGFGLVLAEAMACLLPVISTDCGGTAEVIGDAGTLVPSRNPKALAEGISGVITMPREALQDRVQQARMRVVSRFSLQSTSEHWYEIYRGNRRA